MATKELLIGELRAELERWDALVAGFDAQRRDEPMPDTVGSLRETLGHLRGWQQVSNARMAAALGGGEPAMPAWTGGLPPDDEAQLDAFNARIAAEHAALPWETVHALWRAGFARLLEQAAAAPEGLLLERGRLAWLEGHALGDVLAGSREHHREHREEIEARLGGA
jgi:hypothetical protein